MIFSRKFNEIKKQSQKFQISLWKHRNFHLWPSLRFSLVSIYQTDVTSFDQFSKFFFLDFFINLVRVRVRVAVRVRSRVWVSYMAI